MAECAREGKEVAKCLHCFACCPTAGISFDKVLRVRQLHAKPGNEFVPWWPSQLPSPTMYFALKRRQLCRAVADADARPSAWRAEPSAAGAVPSQLRARRGLPQLSLQLPDARTNLDKDAHVEYMYSFCVACNSSAASSGPGSARCDANATTARPAAQQQAAEAALPPLPPADATLPREGTTFGGFRPTPQPMQAFVASAPIPIPQLRRAGGAHKRRLAETPPPPPAPPPAPAPAPALLAPRDPAGLQLQQGCAAGGLPPLLPSAAGLSWQCAAPGPLPPAAGCGVGALQATLLAMQASLAAAH